MLEIQAFGPVDLRADNGDLRALLTQPKRLALLLYLILIRPQRLQRRDTLLALFWPELDDARARNALSQSLSFLRRGLPPMLLQVRGDEEVGVDPAGIRCDVLEFERALGEERWADAVDLYRGELLAGLHVPDAPGFEFWLDVERERLRELAAGAAWSLARQRIQAGELVLAERTGQLAMRLVPTDESPVREFIRALSEAGDRAAALRFYERFEGILAEQLEVEPAPETVAVVAAIREGNQATRRSRPEAVRVESGGEVVRSPADRDAAAEPAEPVAAAHAIGAPTHRPRTTRWLKVGAAISIVALLGVAAFIVRGRKTLTAATNRVAVLPFENHTGDPALDPLGVVAADWITSGLAGIEIVQVVSVPSVAAALDERGANPDRPLWIARRTGAGLVVTGTLVGVGDSLELRSQLVDPLHGEVLHAFDPLRAPRSDPTKALRPLRRQVMGFVAHRVDERFRGLAMVDEPEPPSYEAYRAYMAGIELGFEGRFEQAIQELDRASAADSTFLAPGVWVVVAFTSMGQPARADSVIGRLEPRRDRLSEMERVTLDIYRSNLRGDLAAAYRLARDGYRRHPTTETRFMAGYNAYRTNRPREAVQTLRAEPESGASRSQRSTGYHRTLTGALHGLEEYRQELNAAREARVRFPEELEPVFWEARALIGLGRIDQSMATVDRGLTLTSESMSPGDLLLQVGTELRFHGRPQLAERALRRGLDWYRANARSAEYRYGVGRALLWLDHADSAVLVFRDLVADAPASLDRLGYLGLALAAAGRLEEARRVDASLAAWSEPYVRGRHLYWRAAIAARLGEKERATALLRDAVSQGVSFSLLRENEDLRPLWGFPPLQKLLEPIG